MCLHTEGVPACVLFAGIPHATQGFDAQVLEVQDFIGVEVSVAVPILPDVEGQPARGEIDAVVHFRIFATVRGQGLKTLCVREVPGWSHGGVAEEMPPRLHEHRVSGCHALLIVFTQGYDSGTAGGTAAARQRHDGGTNKKKEKKKEREKTCSKRGSEQGHREGFEEFWRVYPRKVGKREAVKAWKQTARERPGMEELVEKVMRLAGSEQWRKDGGRFVPYPATWLRRGGWDDEVEGEGARGGGFVMARAGRIPGLDDGDEVAA